MLLNESLNFSSLIKKMCQSDTKFFYACSKFSNVDGIKIIDLRLLSLYVNIDKLRSFILQILIENSLQL